MKEGCSSNSSQEYLDNLNLNNYKGLFFEDERRAHENDPVTGAHFEYKNLYMMLKEIQKKRKLEEILEYSIPIELDDKEKIIKTVTHCEFGLNKTKLANRNNLFLLENLKKNILSQKDKVGLNNNDIKEKEYTNLSKIEEKRTPFKSSNKLLESKEDQLIVESSKTRRNIVNLNKNNFLSNTFKDFSFPVDFHFAKNETKNLSEELKEIKQNNKYFKKDFFWKLI